MKSLSTILAAALVAGSCTVAMAQGAGGADSTQQGTMKDADKNPTGAGANPAAGNTAGSGQMSGPSGGMTSAPAANTAPPSRATPPGGAGTGGVK